MTDRFGRRPDFEPYRDFVEWEAFDTFWFQLGQGEALPAHPLRFRVEDIDAEHGRVEREVDARCSAITRIPGLVGNTLGFWCSSPPTDTGRSIGCWSEASRTG